MSSVKKPRAGKGKLRHDENVLEQEQEPVNLRQSKFGISFFVLQSLYLKSVLQTLVCQLSSTLMQLVRVEKTLIQTLACQLSSTLMQLLFSFDQDMTVEKTVIQTLACQLSSTFMQLLFSFEQDMRVEKTFACQLSSTLMPLLFPFDQT